jgi:lysophospholipase L1-like esterase
MLGLLASVAVGLTSLAESPTVAQATTTPVQYYVAMGDSLAAGTGASTTANDYVSLVYQHELARHPGLQLENLGCGGATSASVVNGPGCSYTTGTQLGDAEAFLRSHPGQVEMLTIDIGANDVDGCIGSSGINTSCLQSGLNQITTNLPLILRGLRAADPNLAIYGMDYYDPFLNQWLTGASGQTVAQQSEAGAVVLNDELGQLYSANKAAMADPATLFQTPNFALTGTYNGATVPENVALICAWTLMCSENNIHANDQGHAELALAFESVIDQPPTTSVLFPAGGATVSGTAVLDATASDVGYIAGVQFALTGGPLNGTVVGTAVPTIYGYLFELNTTTVPNGSYTLQSIASDTAGNSGSSVGIPITVDNPPPTTSMVIPSSGGTTVSGTTVFDASAADAGGVAKVQFALTGGTLSQTVVGTATPTIYGYLLGLDTTTVPNGTYTVQSVATDSAGNAGYSPGVQITIDNAPPTTSVVIPSSSGVSLSGTVVLDAAASGGGGVAKVQFALTGGTLNQTVVGTATPTLYGYLFGLNTTTVPNGIYTLQSVASNSVGNTGYSPGVQVTIAN